MADHIRRSFGNRKSKTDNRLTISPTDLNAQTRSVSEYDLPSVTYWKPEDDFAAPYYLNSALPVSTPELRIQVETPPNSPPLRDSSLGQVDQSPLTSDATSEFEYSNNFVQRGSVFQPFHKVVLCWDKLNAFVLSPEERLPFVKKSKLHPTYIAQPLRNVSGVAYAGNTVAVIGPTGAGKTALLNVLSGQYSKKNLKVDGQICVNNETASLSALRAFVYVPSETVFSTCLTVKEHLTFHAYLRNEQCYFTTEKDTLVLDMIKAVNLTSISDHRLDHDISTLQLRQVCIATACLTNPAAIFLDEPLANLDAEEAEHVGRLLKAMAIQGKIVMCSLTRPTSEVFGLFDHVALMHKSRMAFYGSMDEVGRFFASVLHIWSTAYNPADHYVRAVSTDADKADRICEQYLMSDVYDTIRRKLENTARLARVHNKAKKMGVTSKTKTDWVYQLKTLLGRRTKGLRRSTVEIKAPFALYAFLGIVLGMTFLPQDYSDMAGVENINGAIFLLAFFLSWLPLCSIKPVFFPQLTLLQIETRFKPIYRFSAFYLSHILLAVPLQAILAVTLMTVSYWLVGLAPSAVSFLAACGIGVLIANAGQAFAFLLASCVFQQPKWRIPVIFLLGVPSTLLAGYLPRLRTMPEWLRPFSYLSWLRYGFQALMRNQWNIVSINEFVALRHACDEDSEDCEELLGTRRFNATWNEEVRFVLKDYGLSMDLSEQQDDVAFNSAMLVCFILLFHFLAVVALWRKPSR
ncbi:hypothetical protein RvY_06785 [Ramazzottius varieornatus]|uniref:ABC transporter domain-containing protein n=1 Tax=Ramazzottius varieornatus TaxID=947166 RepID=A0A1D1V2M2_RAMVA|nr:hypothetical protein RvY_06785 [Ramazzottius varieornatus]